MTTMLEHFEGHLTTKDSIPETRGLYIAELNEEFSQLELVRALEQTNAFIASIERQKEQHLLVSIENQLRKPIRLEQVSTEQQRVQVQDLFTCAVCTHILQDPVCCANDLCNIMMCKSHYTPGMLCPKLCDNQG